MKLFSSQSIERTSFASCNAKKSETDAVLRLLKWAVFLSNILKPMEQVGSLVVCAFGVY